MMQQLAASTKSLLSHLKPDVKQTLEAVGRLAEVLDRAGRDVGDDVVY